MHKHKDLSTIENIQLDVSGIPALGSRFYLDYLQDFLQ